MRKLEQTYPAPPERLWELWTTPAGIESWWAPDGFAVEVEQLDLQVGGELVYTMKARGADQIAFMKSIDMPLATTSRKTFTRTEAPSVLGYTSLVDFVPGVEPYDFATLVELQARESGTLVVMTVDPLHDDEWTERLVAGRSNELENLAGVVAAHG